MGDKTDVWQGTLALMVLKTIALPPLAVHCAAVCAQSSALISQRASRVERAASASAKMAGSFFGARPVSEITQEKVTRGP